MIRPRWHKVLSDLWSNPARSLLVVASIAVGLFAVGIIISIRVVLLDDMRQGYAAIHPPNITVTASLFDQDLVDHVARMPGVSAAQGAFNSSLRIQTGPGEWKSIQLKSVRSFEKMNIAMLRLESGRLPTAKSEIALERNKAEETHASLGDRITLELPNGKTHELTLVGIVHDQTIGASGIGGGFFLAPIQGYILNDSLAFLGYPDKFNTLYATISGDSNDKALISSVANRIRSDLEDTGQSIYEIVQRSSYDHPNSTYVEAISGVLIWLGLFVVFLSAFLVTNTISALLAQQAQQIGVMKTVGARRYQVMGVYMMIIFIYGILAFLVAIPLSYLAANRILEFLADRINFTLQGYRLVPESVGLQVLIALLVPQLAGFIPIFHGASISVQEALSGLSPTAHPVSRGLLGRRLTRALHISRPVVISLRNTFRRKGRLVLTLITLSMGGAVFIATINVRASLIEHIDQIGKYFLADVTLTMSQPYRIDRIQQDLSVIPGIEKVEGWGAAQAEMIMPDGTVSENVHLLAPPAGSQLIEPVVIGGRWLVPGDQNAIVLSELFLSRFPDLRTGSTLRLKINGEENDWVVVGFFQLAGKSGGFLAYVNYEPFSEEIHQSNRALTYRIVASNHNLDMNGQQALAAQVETRLKNTGYLISDIQAGSYLQASASKGLNVLTIFLLIMAVLTAMVGSIGLTGTMGMNVMERTREIGVMRSIGASNGILIRLVLLEGLLTGLVSWLVGSLSAFPMSKLMSDTINEAIFDTSTGFVFAPGSLALWMGLVIVLSVLASLLPARNATRLTIREVLAYE